MQSAMGENSTLTVPEDAPRAGFGPCLRCLTEVSPHPCPGFVSAVGEPSNVSVCQRNWCGHSFADHN